MCVCVVIVCVQSRNKPTEPTKQPTLAPFFIPTLPGLEMTYLSATASDGGIPDQETNQVHNVTEL